jgi:uncharacterized protein
MVTVRLKCIGMEHHRMSIADDISKLNELKQSGAIDDQEYQKAKDALFAKQQNIGTSLQQGFNNVAENANAYSMYIHLSQLCGFLVPFAGLVEPIVLWQIKKNESEVIDQHGRIVVNWIITEVILAVIFGLLCFALIGIPLVIILCVVGIVFPIIGGLKANDGNVWAYPCSFKFF